MYEIKCPKDCTACMDACPTGAIYEPLKLDPRRCIAFNAWWTQDGRPCVTSNIPSEIREKMDIRVHGCDVCQEACPRNSAKFKAKLPQDPLLVQLAEEISLPKMLEMPDQFYKRAESVQSCTTTSPTESTSSETPPSRWGIQRDADQYIHTGSERWETPDP